MLNTLKGLLASLAPPPPGAEAGAHEHTLQLASAVLLVEVMRSDGRSDDAERAKVLQVLRQRFELTDAEARQLAERAEQVASDATDLFGLTSHVNAHFDMPAKLRMVEYMWAVAYADGELDAHEQHVMWRLADLLHVPHGAYIHAKMRARDGAGGG
jgi:uncharacterized tellurite resistance protein B-like protein